MSPKPKMKKILSNENILMECNFESTEMISLVQNNKGKRISFSPLPKSKHLYFDKSKGLPELKEKNLTTQKVIMRI